ncbi:hypothetical protein K438DRAFT_1882103 [Mycena galopus ATCC 62051]|nr:hypothetical protein K438DRAFT_1882103 [Mycena galopus ATCC 62051]
MANDSQEALEIQHVSKRKTKVVVSEAWALEYPHHGRPAILNEYSLVTLNARPDGHWFARAMARFMDSGLVKANKIIPVGYSASTGVVILATKGMDLQNISILILVEPGAL